MGSLLNTCLINILLPLEPLGAVGCSWVLWWGGGRYNGTRKVNMGFAKCIKKPERKQEV